MTNKIVVEHCGQCDGQGGYRQAGAYPDGRTGHVSCPECGGTGHMVREREVGA